jgi:uncharacterized protein
MSGAMMITALLMGLTGSLHCAGMCGPIVWVMPFHGMSGMRKWAGIFLYHAGRISMYAFMALVLHSFRSLFQPQWQQYVSIGIGGLLLLIGLLYFIPGNKLQMKLPYTRYIQQKLGKFIGDPSLTGLLLAGVMNGLLPCGLVYIALSSTIALPHTTDAVLLMYIFGAGTLPMLVGLTVVRNKVSFLQRFKIRRFVPVLMFLFGCLFVLRGMNLGIPYLSPKVAVEQQTIKSSCCHKE